MVLREIHTFSFTTVKLQIIGICKRRSYVYNMEFNAVLVRVQNVMSSALAKAPTNDANDN